MNTISIGGGPLSTVSLALAFFMASLILLVIHERFPRLWVSIIRGENRGFANLAVGLALISPQTISKGIVSLVVTIVLTAAVIIYLLNSRTGAIGAMFGNNSMLAVGTGVIGFVIVLVIILGIYNSGIDGGSTGGDTITSLWSGIDPANLTPTP